MFALALGMLFFDFAQDDGFFAGVWRQVGPVATTPAAKLPGAPVATTPAAKLPGAPVATTPAAKLPGAPVATVGRIRWLLSSEPWPRRGIHALLWDQLKFYRVLWLVQRASYRGLLKS
jgi:hypothetical protein